MKKFITSILMALCIACSFAQVKNLTVNEFDRMNMKLNHNYDLRSITNYDDISETVIIEYESTTRYGKVVIYIDADRKEIRAYQLPDRTKEVVSLSKSQLISYVNTDSIDTDDITILKFKK